MSQHDMNIENQGFPAFRSDLNNALAAIASTSSGTSEPSTTFANQLWYDSSNNLLKFRNEDNDAWITLAYLDQTNDEWEVRSAVIQAVDSAGVVIKTDDGTTRLTIADDGTATFANNVTFQSNAFFGDNDTIRMGDGNDLSIYFNGTNSYFQGDAVRISSNQINLMNGAATENYIVCTNNAGVDLKYDNANKLQTTASGVVVTGGVSFDAGSNYLDDYEEGTFTPTFAGLGTNPTCTYDNIQFGYYQRVGQWVHCTGALRTDAVSGGGGQLVIAGFPFQSENNTITGAQARQSGTIGQAYSWGGKTPVAGYIHESTTPLFFIFKHDTTSALSEHSVLDVTDLVNATNSNGIHFSVSYKIND